jgi:glycosyltransferase involved in cell wall biosynthesis
LATKIIARAPRITVVLPVYNGERYLRDSIASILAQDIEFELVVSDDRSKDSSLRIVETLADPRICILRNDVNAGIFGNLNRCIRAARGDLVQVFSQDDLMQPGYLAAQAALLAKHPDAGLVCNSPVYIDANGRRLGASEGDVTPERIEWPLYRWIASHYGAISASISSVMIPRRTFESVGLFDPSFPLAGDIEFYNRVAERFVIVRNIAPLHEVRNHAGMTSAQSASGAGYLDEERRLSEWYRRQWDEKEWRKVRHFRSDLRGRYHLGWIRRAAMRGEWRVAAQGLRKLDQVYPLRSVVWWQIAHLFRWQLRTFPEVAPLPVVQKNTP